LKNLDVRTTKGIKKGSYDAAKEVYEDCGHILKAVSSHCRLIITGHSKGAAEALAFKRMYKTKMKIWRTYAYCPPKVLSIGNKHEYMDRTYLFIDPDDMVSDVGWPFLKHPDAYTVYSKDNIWSDRITDHEIGRMIKFLRNCPSSK